MNAGLTLDSGGKRQLEYLCEINAIRMVGWLNEQRK